MSANRGTLDGNGVVVMAKTMWKTEENLALVETEVQYLSALDDWQHSPQLLSISQDKHQERIYLLTQ